MDYQDYILYRGLEFEVLYGYLRLKLICPRALFRQTIKLDLCKEASSYLSYNSEEYSGAQTKA